MNMTDHVRSWIYLTIAEQTWNQLSEEDQSAIEEAAQIAQDYERELFLESLETDRQYLEEQGMTFVEVDNAAFAEAARGAVLDNVSDDIRPTVEQLFEQSASNGSSSN